MSPWNHGRTGLARLAVALGIGLASAGATLVPDPYPRAGFRAQLAPPTFHNVAGTVTIVDEDTLQIDHFDYDGLGEGLVYFYLAKDTTQQAFIQGLEIGPNLFGTVYQDASLTIDLPAGTTLDGYDFIGVWCVPAAALFGAGAFRQPEPELYCTAKLSSQGCLPTFETQGRPRVSGTEDFFVRGVETHVGDATVLFLGSAPNAQPFLGGTLCIAPPVQRLSLVVPGGTFGVPCDGVVEWELNGMIRSGQYPFLQAGSKVYAQYWFRDVAQTPIRGLSNGLTFSVAP